MVCVEEAEPDDERSCGGAQRADRKGQFGVWRFAPPECKVENECGNAGGNSCDAPESFGAAQLVDNGNERA